MTRIVGAEGAADAIWAAFEGASDAIAIVDEPGRILFANGAAEQLLGRAAGGLRGVPLLTLLAARCQSRLAAQLVHADAAWRSTDDAGGGDLFAVHEDGREIAVEISIGRAGGPGIPARLAVIRDIRERVRTESRHEAAAMEAREARSRLEELLEVAPAFIIAINRSGTIEYINHVLPQYSKEQVIGSFWLDYFAPDLHHDMNLALEAIFATGAPQTNETTTTGPDGAALWFATHMAPLRDDGRVVGAILVSQDITERKRAQIELLGARRMAILGTLAASVAHEINTPIQFVGDNLRFLSDSARAILALVERLQVLRGTVAAGVDIAALIASAAQAEEEADLVYLREQMPAAFEQGIEGLNRVTAIVHALKEFAHPVQEQMVAADLNHAIQNTLTITAGEYKYVAELQTEFGDIPAVVCHEAQISQAILNIVVNAAHAVADVVKGTDRKGIIGVRTWREGDSVLVAVRDTGGGIPESIRSRIFDPFFTTKEVGKGTGQGLALAWSIVKEKHEGELAYETKLGHGTTFVMRLPISGKCGRTTAGGAPETGVERHGAVSRAT